MIIAGTGHRPQKLPSGFSMSHVFAIRAKREIRKALEALKPEYGISGMALGFDTWLAEALVKLEIPFIAAIPCKGQEEVWNQTFRDHYRWLISKAWKVHTIGEVYNATCMQKRNMWMIDQLRNREDRLIALWDGTRGGTSNCIRYAKDQGIEVINLWSSI